MTGADRRFGEHEGPAARFVYEKSHRFFNKLGSFAFGLSAGGVENIPEEGGAILALNHLHFSDVLWVPAVVPDRAVVVIGRREKVYMPVIGAYLRWMGAKAIDRPKEGERASRDVIPTMVEPLEAGRLEVIYGSPNTRTPGIKPGFPTRGIFEAAERAQVPIVPGVVVGSDRLGSFRGAEVTVKFAPAMPYPQHRREHREMQYHLWGTQTELFESVPSVDGHYADAPNPESR